MKKNLMLSGLIAGLYSLSALATLPTSVQPLRITSLTTVPYNRFDNGDMVTASVEGGIPPYTFSLDDKDTKSASPRAFTTFRGVNADPNPHTITISDSTGQSAAATITTGGQIGISRLHIKHINAQNAKGQLFVSAFGKGNKTITLSTASASNVKSSKGNSTTFEDLAEGDYVVTVSSDENAETVSAAVTIVKAAAPAVSTVQATEKVEAKPAQRAPAVQATQPAQTAQTAKPIKVDKPAQDAKPAVSATVQNMVQAAIQAAKAKAQAAKDTAQAVPAVEKTVEAPKVVQPAVAAPAKVEQSAVTATQGAPKKAKRVVSQAQAPKANLKQSLIGFIHVQTSPQNCQTGLGGSIRIEILTEAELEFPITYTITSGSFTSSKKISERTALFDNVNSGTYTVTVTDSSTPPDFGTITGVIVGSVRPASNKVGNFITANYCVGCQPKNGTSQSSSATSTASSSTSAVRSRPTATKRVR